MPWTHLEGLSTMQVRIYWKFLDKGKHIIDNLSGRRSFGKPC